MQVIAVHLHGIPSTRQVISTALYLLQHVFVCRDAVRKPVQQPYDGPFAVLQVRQVLYTPQWSQGHGVYRSAKASIYQSSSLPRCCSSILNSTNLFTCNISCCADHSTADIPTHIVCPTHSTSNLLRPPCSLANSSSRFRSLVSHWGSDETLYFTLFCSVVIPYLFSQTRDFCLMQYFVSVKYQFIG